MDWDKYLKTLPKASLVVICGGKVWMVTCPNCHQSQDALATRLQVCISCGLHFSDGQD